MCKEKSYCRPLFWVYQNCHTCYFVSQNCNKCYISRQNFTLRKHRHCETQTVKFIRNQQKSCLFMNRINKVVIQRTQQDRGLKHISALAPDMLAIPHDMKVGNNKEVKTFSLDEEIVNSCKLLMRIVSGCHFLHFIHFPVNI